MSKVYFVTTFSLVESEKSDFDEDTPEFSEAYKNHLDYMDMSCAYLRSLREKYPEYDEWVNENSFEIPCHPYANDIFEPETAACFLDIVEPFPENAPRPTRDELQKMNDLWQKEPDFFADVPKKVESIWEVEHHRTVGFFDTLERAKTLIEENDCDWEEAGYYNMALIEAMESGMYPSPKKEELCLYSCEEGWIPIEPANNHVANCYLYKGKKINGNIGVSLG